MFGLGFKSVFKISKNPKIFSGDYNFSFNHKTLAYPFLESKPKGYKPERTYVVLDLKEEIRTEIHESIRNYYSKVSELILFLKHLNTPGT